jgi:peptidoglycan/LPS O-acetylase OafA/YrhL
MLIIADHCHVPESASGFFGVDLFFVLSGFLITRILVDEFDARGRIGLPGFYLRRFLRLGPPLLLLLAAYLAIAPIAWPQFTLLEHVRDAGLAGFYLSDYARAYWQHPKVLTQTWSLSIEEHFYLIWPFAVLLLARVNTRWRIASLFGLYLLATAWRIFEYEHTDWETTYFRFDTRMSGLIAGALLAISLARINKISDETANAFGILACGALIPCLATGYWLAPGALVWMTTLVEIAAMALLIAASAQKSWVSSLLSVPPLVGVGIISYGLYLWHYPAAVFFRVRLPWYQTAPIVLIFAFVAATVSYVTIERPLQRFRRSLSARHRAADRVTEAANEDCASLPATATATTAS